MIEFIQKNRPLLIAGLLALVGGFILGTIYAYYISPAEYTDTTPEILRRDLQVDYMRMAIDSYSVNHNIDLAVQRWEAIGRTNAVDIFTKEIQADTKGQTPEAILNYGRDVQAVLSSAEPGGSEETSTAGGSSSFLKSFLIIGGILALLAVVGAGVYYLLRLFRPSNSSGVVSPAMHAQEINRQASRTDYGSLGLADPVARTMTTYVEGYNLYNETYNIMSPAGEDLGDYGIEISDFVGVGEAKRVTALEVWLFDKNDFKTATKVVLSAHAFNDPAERQKLEAKGELMLAEISKKIVLETSTLQMLVTITDLVYGQGPLPTNSYFERITCELAVWPIQG